MNFDNLNVIEDSINEDNNLNVIEDSINEDNNLTEDQKIIQLLNNKIIDIDKSINKEIKYINKTLCMLITDINNIKYVLNSFENKKIILNNIN